MARKRRDAGETKTQTENGVRKNPNTGHYEALVYLGRDPETGKTRWRSQTFAHKPDAIAWREKLRTQKAEGSYRPSLSKLTLTAYLRDKWLPMYRTQVRSTYTIEKCLGKWVFFTSKDRPSVPYFGDKALQKLTVADFDRLYAAMAESGVQRRGIEHPHGILKRALKAAVKKGELPRNPVEFATLPKPNVHAEKFDDEDDDIGPVQALTAEQATRFLAAAKDDRMSALWHLLLDAALRPGEAFALKWKHIDEQRGMVKVRATLARVRGELRKAKGQGWMVTRPKTAASEGDVPITDATIWLLKKWRQQQEEERRRMGSEWRDHGFVFTTENGSPLGNNIGRHWTRMLREADAGRGDLGTWGEKPPKKKTGPKAGKQRPFKPKFSMYVLRHTRLTLLANDGVDLLTISLFARHKTPLITARFYVHKKAADTKPQVMETFERLLASS